MVGGDFSPRLRGQELAQGQAGAWATEARTVAGRAMPSSGPRPPKCRRLALRGTTADVGRGRGWNGWAREAARQRVIGPLRRGSVVPRSRIELLTLRFSV